MTTECRSAFRIDWACLSEFLCERKQTTKRQEINCTSFLLRYSSGRARGEGWKIFTESRMKITQSARTITDPRAVKQWMPHTRGKRPLKVNHAYLFHSISLVKFSWTTKTASTAALWGRCTRTCKSKKPETSPSNGTEICQMYCLKVCFFSLFLVLYK